MNAARPMPHNLETERSLLGVVLLQNDLLYEASQIITATDFFEPYHEELWKLFLDQITIGRSVTPFTVLQDISQDADIGGIRASVYIRDLAQNAPPPSRNITISLAHAIRNNAMKRRVIGACQEMMEFSFSAPPSISGDELRAEYDGIMAGLYRSITDLGIKHVAEIGDGVLETIKIATTSGAAAGLDSGLVAINDLLGRLVPGRVYALGGAPGSGKSALAQQVAETVAQPAPQPRIALFYSIEMPGEEVGERSLSRRTGIPARQIESGTRIDREENERLFDANLEAKKSGFYVTSVANATVAMIRSSALRKQRLGGLDLLVIDHLDYIAAPDGKMKPVEAYNHNLVAIKQMAKDLRIPVILLVQFATEALRDMAKWPHRRPTQGDLLYAGFVERHVDAIMLIHRPEYFLLRNVPDKADKHYPDWERRKIEWEGLAEFIVTKSRGGIGFGTRQARWHGPTTSFSDNGERVEKPVGLFAQNGPF